MRRICEAFINDMQKNCGLHKNAGFSQPVRRRNQKIPAVRTMRTPGNKSRQLLTQKTGLSQNDV